MTPIVDLTATKPDPGSSFEPAHSVTLEPFDSRSRGPGVSHDIEGGSVNEVDGETRNPVAAGNKDVDVFGRQQLGWEPQEEPSRWRRH